MTENDQQEAKTLEGEAAVDLWRKGRKAWNSWIKQNPGWNISFAQVDFVAERDSDGKLSFSGYNFVDGSVIFADAKFGDGDVSFSDTIFGDRGVYFTLAKFGNGTLSFNNAQFGNGGVSFEYTDFGNGTLQFFKTRFGNGDLTFREATFGKCTLIFSKGSFGNCNVNFSFAKFEDGRLQFQDITFGKGNIDFSSTTINNLGFSSTTFDDNTLKFNNTNLTKLIFKPQAIESSRIEASGLSIKRQAIFELPVSASTLEFFNLHGSSFDGPLTLSGNIGTVPDLRASRYTHQVDLSALEVKLRRTPQSRNWFKKLSAVAEHPEDAARLRRIKEIAEANKDHQAALRFSADENRAKRWRQTSKLGSILDIAFSALSNYGQSILRPFFGLFFFFCVFTSLYLANSTEMSFEISTGWLQSMLLSASNSLPFLPQSRSVRDEAIKVLHCVSPSLWVNAIMIGQGILSFIFLFLIGLGLRNRFRL